MDIYSDRVHPSATLGPHAGGREALVQLDPDHPGFNDAAYRARRDTIARLALEYCDGDPAPTVPYTEEEHGVWSRVWNELGPLHERWACRAYLEALELVELDRSRIPQLAEVNAVIESRQGFQMLPVAGLIKAKNFLRYLGRGRFLSTQYIRHHSCPLYTPEPDIVHELVGHASSLAHPAFARLTTSVVSRFEEEGIKCRNHYYHLSPMGPHPSVITSVSSMKTTRGPTSPVSYRSFRIHVMIATRSGCSPPNSFAMGSANRLTSSRPLALRPSASSDPSSSIASREANPSINLGADAARP